MSRKFRLGLGLMGLLLAGGIALLLPSAPLDIQGTEEGTLDYGKTPHFHLEFTSDSGRAVQLSCGDVNGAACAAAYLQGELLLTQGLEILQGVTIEPLKGDEFDGFGVYLDDREILRLLREG